MAVCKPSTVRKVAEAVLDCSVRTVEQGSTEAPVCIVRKVVRIRSRTINLTRGKQSSRTSIVVSPAGRSRQTEPISGTT